MIEAATIGVRVVTDASSAQAGLRSVGDQLNDIGRTAQRWGLGLTSGVTAPLALLGNKAITAASDMAESMNKVNVVFGDASGTITTFAQTAATNLGMSEQAALEAAGTFGNLFSASGVAGQAAADMSTGILQLAADLGSFNNIDPGIMLEKLRSGLVGEAEPLRAVGVLLTEASVKAQAMKMGLAATTEELTQADLVQARYALILQQTTLAQGDFARTADGLANATRTQQATFQDLAATIGTQLLPIKLQLTQIITDLLTRFQGLSPQTQQMVVVFGALAAAAGPLLMVLGTLATAIGAIGAPILAVVAAVAALALAWQTNFGGIRDVTNEVAEQLREAWAKVVEFFQPTIERLKTAFGEFRESLGPLGAKFRELWTVIGPILTKAGEIIGVVLVGAFNLLLEVVAAVMPSIGSIVSNAIDIVIAIVNGLKATFTEMIAIIKALIAGDWSAAWEHAKALFQALADAVGTIAEAVWDTITTLFADILEGIGNWLGNINEEAGRQWDEFWQTVNDKLTGVYEAVSDWMGRALDFLRNINLIAIGRDMITGLANGIWDRAMSYLKAKLESIGNLIPQWIKDLLGIHSPSTVFYQIGLDLIAGLVKSLENQRPEVIEAIGGVLSAIASVMDAIGRAAEWRPVQALKERLQALIADIRTVTLAFAELMEWARKSGSPDKRAADVMEYVQTVASGMAGMADALAKVAGFQAAGGLGAKIKGLVEIMREAIDALAGIPAEGLAGTSQKAGLIGFMAGALGQVADAWTKIGAIEMEGDPARVINWLVEVTRQIAAALTRLQAQGGLVFADTFRVFVDNLTLAFKPLKEAADFAEQLAAFTWPDVRAVDVIAWLKAVTGFVAQAVIALQNSKQWTIIFPAEFKTFAENLRLSFGPLSAALDFAKQLEAFAWPEAVAVDVIAWLKSVTGFVAQAVIALQKSKQWALAFPAEFQTFVANLILAFGPLSAALDFAKKLESFQWPAMKAPEVIAWLKAVAGFTAKAMIELQKSKSWRLKFPTEFQAFTASLSAAFAPLSAALDFAKKLESFTWPAVKAPEVIAWLKAVAGFTAKAMIELQKSKSWRLKFPTEFQAFTASLSAAFAPLSAAVDFVAKLDGFQFVAGIREITAYLVEAVRLAVEGLEGVRKQLSAIGMQPGPEFSAFIEAIRGIFGPLGDAMDFLSRNFTKVAVPPAEFWRPVFDWIEATFAEFETWLRQNYPTTPGEAQQFGPVSAFGQALGALMGGLKTAMDTALAIPQKWERLTEADWRPLFDWVQMAFSAFENWLNRPRLTRGGPGRSGLPFRSPDVTVGANLVSAFGQALGALMGGLKSAMDVALGIPKTWGRLTAADWQPLFDWVQMAFSAFENWLKRPQLTRGGPGRSGLPFRSPDVTVGADLVTAFGQALGALMGGLKSAMDVALGIPKTWGRLTAADWAPFFAWVQNTFADFQKWIEDTYPTSPEGADHFGPVAAFANAMNALFGGLASALDVLKGLQGYIPLLRKRIDVFVTNVKQTFEIVAEVANRPEVQAANESVSKFSAAIGALFGGLKEALSLFESLSNGGLTAFLGGSRTTGSPFKQAVADLLESISGTLAAFRAYVQGPNAGEWTETAAQFLANVRDVFDTLKAGLDLFQELVSAKMPTGAQLQGFLDMVIDIFTQFSKTLEGPSVAGKWRSSGQKVAEALVDGLLEGLKNAASRIESGVVQVSDAVKEAIRQAFGIASPSRVMFGFGQQIGVGLALGIVSTSGQVAGAMGAMVPVLPNSNTTIWHRYDLRVNGSALSPEERAELKRFLVRELRMNR